jgi:hypothetical protein
MPVQKNHWSTKSFKGFGHLKNIGIKTSLFDWPNYLENMTTHPDEIHDLADCLKAESIHQECGPGHLPYLFLALLNHKENKDDGSP